MAKDESPKFRMTTAAKARYTACADVHGWDLTEWVLRALDFCADLEEDRLVDLANPAFDEAAVRMSRVLRGLPPDQPLKIVDEGKKKRPAKKRS